MIIVIKNVVTIKFVTIEKFTIKQFHFSGSFYLLFIFDCFQTKNLYTYNSYKTLQDINVLKTM